MHPYEIARQWMKENERRHTNVVDISVARQARERRRATRARASGVNQVYGIIRQQLEAEKDRT